MVLQATRTGRVERIEEIIDRTIKENPDEQEYEIVFRKKWREKFYPTWPEMHEIEKLCEDAGWKVDLSEEISPRRKFSVRLHRPEQN